MKTMMVALIGCMVAILIAGCSPQATPEPPTATLTIAPAATPTMTETLRPTVAPTRTSAPTVTKSPTVARVAKASPTSKAPSIPETDPALLALLEPIKQGAPDADFTAARLAYAQSEGYDPYGMQYADLKTEMYAALDRKEYEKALELANEVMQYYYLSPNAHMAAFVANDELGHVDEAEFHRYVLRGLVSSLEESGDGKSMETAYEVILIEEEYLLLDWLDIKPAGQKLVGDDEHSYDLFETSDPQTNKPIKVYFNIDIPFKAFAHSFQ